MVDSNLCSRKDTIPKYGDNTTTTKTMHGDVSNFSTLLDIFRDDKVVNRGDAGVFTVNEDGNEVW